MLRVKGRRVREAIVPELLVLCGACFANEHFSLRAEGVVSRLGDGEIKAHPIAPARSVEVIMLFATLMSEAS